MCIHMQLYRMSHLPALHLHNPFDHFSSFISLPSFLSLVPLQCTQGTKGLLESATIPPLLSASCPQGKPHSARSCPDKGPAVNPDPELPTSCGRRPAAGSPPARHAKARAKKSKRAAQCVPNPSLDGPVSPASPDAGPGSQAGGHVGATFASLH